MFFVCFCLCVGVSLHSQLKWKRVKNMFCVTLGLNNVLQHISDHLFWVSSAQLCTENDFFWRVFIIYTCSGVAEFIWEMPMKHFFKTKSCFMNDESSGASSVIRTTINDHKVPLLWSSLLILPVSHSFSLLREKYHKELNLMPNPNLAVVHLLYQGSLWAF